MLEGKVAIVTGGGKGIERHAALTFAQEKARVVIADVNQEWLQKTASELGRLTETLPVNADVRNEDNVKKMVDQALKRFGHIDVLVNNAVRESRKKRTRSSSGSWSSTILPRKTMTRT